MSEVQNTAQPSPAPAAAPAAPEAKPTGLEKVYQDFQIEDTAQTFQPQSPQPAAQPAAPQPVAPKVPDPFDPNFANYQQQLAQGLTVLQQGVSQTRQELAAMQSALHREKTEADIKRAAGTLADKAGIDNDIAEVAFEARARKDPRLLAIWNNRGKNPKALSAALEALAGELKDKYTVRQDPQLVENQRAVRASQQQMATTQRQTSNDEFEGMTPAQRQDYVRRKYING